jgi:ELWxxDGT repeat protein
MSAGIVVVNGIAYLLADGGAGPEPWRSDGTAAGTAQVEDLTSGARGAQVYAATRLGDGIVFRYSSEPGSADGIWRITSATSGATRLKSGFITRPPINAGSRVFFGFSDSSGTESLWVTDGTGLGTRQAFSASAGSLLGIADLLGGDGVLFFSGSPTGSGAANQLWVTNGAPGAQRSLGTLPGMPVFPSRAVLLNGVPLLAATDASHGTEPWTVRNAAPVAVADNATVTGGSSVVVNVRSNDTDADSLAADLEVALVSTAAHGTAVVENNSVRYTPNAGFVGDDSFQYRLTDELGSQSAAITVTVTVNAAPAGGGGGGGTTGGGGGGGSLDLILLAALTAGSYRRWRRVHTPN